MNNHKFFHSVYLNEELCNGCINCIKRCPTQAIRVRNGRAVITSQFCIDCGECIRICAHHAKRSHFDHPDIIKNYKYKGSPTFSKTSQWECDYAISMFTKKHGSCYDYGAQFAFVANAIGCKKAYAVSSGGHGWAEVDGYVYDLAWEQIDKQHSYFKRSYNAKAGGLAPNYKRARNYVRKI